MRIASSVLAVATRRLRTLPNARDWAEVAGMALVLALTAYAISHWSNAFTFDISLPGLRADLAAFLGLAVIAVLVPALAEEAIFRGLLQPRRLTGPRTILISALSLTAFIAWHPIQVWTGWFTGQAIFLDPGFLCVAGLLGFACTISVHRSDSLWGAVALHWAVVVVWKAGS